MPHLSRSAQDAVSAVRTACTDATSAPALAERVLAILHPVLAVDGAEILALDSDALVFTRVLAHRGGRLADLAYFLRDIYLIVRDPEWLDIQPLLRTGRGAGAFHERFDRWLRAEPPPMAQPAFTRLWRRLGSPAGGGVRYGLAHRGRWVALLQAARWHPGPGFRASDLELLDRIAPTLSAALAVRLDRGDLPHPDTPVPPAGHIMLNEQRRVVALDAAADDWLARLTDDGLAAAGNELPVAAQSVANQLAGSSLDTTSCHVVDQYGVAVAVSAQRARPMSRLPRPHWYSVTVAAAPLHAGHPAFQSLTRRQRHVAAELAHGLTDKQIATRLGLAVSTVHDHVTTLHRLFGTQTRSALVARLK